MHTPTFEQVLQEARLLPPPEQLRLSEVLAQEARTTDTNERREAVRRAKGSMRGLLPTTEQFLAEKHAELEREESMLPEPRA